MSVAFRAVKAFGAVLFTRWLGSITGSFCAKSGRAHAASAASEKVFRAFIYYLFPFATRDLRAIPNASRVPPRANVEGSGVVEPEAEFSGDGAGGGRDGRAVCVEG